MKRAPKQKPSFSLNNDESKSRKSGQQLITWESDFRLCHFDLSANYRIYYIHNVFSVYMANIQPSPLDISPRLRLGLIYLGLGCILAIYTLKPWYIYYIYILYIYIYMMYNSNKYSWTLHHSISAIDHAFLTELSEAIFIEKSSG